MENLNLAHPFSRRNTAYAAANAAGKSVYDDVFGGGPKYGLNSLAPRLQDYTEIFGGFHSSRGSSSIPVLDLPIVDGDYGFVSGDAELRRSRFDYSEVFGGINGVDFAVSFEDLVNEANGGYDSSDEAWSPANSGSLSGETEPSAWSEGSQSFTNNDIDLSVDDTTHFSVSYHKTHLSNEDLSSGMAHIAHLHAVPGYTCVVDETSLSQKVENEKPHKVSDDLNGSHDFEERVIEEKRFSKSMSLPANTGFRGHGNYLSPSGKNSKSGPVTHEPVLAVSDISLRTKPSQLPPPSRPPPALGIRRAEPGKPFSKLRASKSYAFERTKSDKLPPFSDVELEKRSSASTVKDAVEKTRTELRSSGGTEEKLEGVQSCINLQMKDDMNAMEQNMIKTSDKCNSSVGDSQGSRTKEGSRVETSAEENKRFTKTSEMVADGIDSEIDGTLLEKSAESKPRRTSATSRVSYITEETVAWREEADFFEVETDDSWMSFKQVKAKKISKKDIETPEDQLCAQATREPFEPDRSYGKLNSSNKAPEWDNNYNQLELADSSSQRIGAERRYGTKTGSTTQPEDQKNGPANGSIHAPETNGEEDLKRVNEDDSITELKQEVEAASERREEKENVKDANSRGEYEMRAEEVSQGDELEEIKENATEHVEYENKETEIPEQDHGETQQKELCARERKKKIQQAFDGKEHEIGLREPLVPMNDKRLKDNTQHESSESIGKMDFAHDDSQREHIVTLNSEDHEEMPMESSRHEDIEKGLEESPDQVTGKIAEQESDKDESSLPFKEGISEKQFKKANGLENIELMPSSASKEPELNQMTGDKERDRGDVGTGRGNLTEPDSTGHSESIHATHLSMRPDTSEVWSCNSNSKLKIEIQDSGEESEDEPSNLYFEKTFNTLEKDQGFLQHEGLNTRAEAVKDFPGVQEHLIKPDLVYTGSEIPHAKHAKVVFCPNDLGIRTVITPEAPPGVKVGGVQVTADKGVTREKVTNHEAVREWVDNAKKIGDALQAVLEDVGDIANTDETGTTECTETKERSKHGISIPKEPNMEKQVKRDRYMDRGHFGTTVDEGERRREREKDLMMESQRVAERLKERELENELRRIKEEREREREKDRMAVDSAIREARDRSYAEARERAERAAVERANAEVRQRAMAEARERLEKAAVEAREARIRAERAAVERATAEARQRAFGRAMAERAHVEVRDKLRSMEMKQSTSSSDSQDIRFHSIGTSSGFRYSYSSAHVGVEGESPQRCKARLERYQRTADRAAKALAEKNMRDLVAQREQEERNRLAEILDAEVRRWSSGKEGNLRALLSTLQYILGPDSGWQPIPLTEVITSASVKRAYRKATLCVHPDKLQQRGANVQQKYICEKVFDLLKDAWNKFNSEER